MNSRRILLCTHARLTKQLGAAKPLLELADALRPLGWEPTLLGPEELAADQSHLLTLRFQTWFPQRLRERLHRVAAEFDVVDYDQLHLPFPRHEFSSSTLMVARSVLLARHLLTHRIPTGPTLKQRVGAIVKGPKRLAEAKAAAAVAHTTFSNADLINVSNRHDYEALVADGLDAKRIVVLPFGIGEDRRATFAQTPLEIPSGPPTIAFVGTFDYRKGAREMPRMLQALVAAVPAIRMKLLGTAGMFTTKSQVLKHFPKRLHDWIDVRPRFEPTDLPALLNDCWAGFFPSHLEGFPQGLLEMLAAGLPVIAYDAPGAPEMLPQDWLVKPGDAVAMASKLAKLITQRDELLAARRWARGRAEDFRWTELASRTALLYEAHIAERRGTPAFAAN